MGNGFKRAEALLRHFKQAFVLPKHLNLALDSALVFL
jgi:hypothetical protein